MLDCAKIEESWRRFCQRLKVEGDLDSIYVSPVMRYLESHRYYHNLHHLNDCLRELEDVRLSLRDENAVEMAVWFHDAVYDPRATDNEAKSSQLAFDTALEMGLGKAFIERVADLILATKHLIVPPETDSDMRYLLDIDLAVFGHPREVFDRDNLNIRTEYIWVPWPVYAQKRAEILQAFLDRPRIYWTDYFDRKYAKRARENLARAIESLQKNARGF